MSVQPARLAEALAPDRAPLGALIIIPVACLVVGQAVLALTGAVPVLEGTLGDTDAYMRLTRVLELHDSGNWFDSRFPRINPPEGHVQHWTRLLDLVLLTGAWLLAPALGFARALHLWGVLISPVCLVLTVIALAWAARPILDREARVFACLMLLLQPTVLAYSSLGRPDHHAPLLLLFVVLLGQTFRLLSEPNEQRPAALAGVVAALGIWLSPEALAFIAPSLAALGFCWLLGDAGMAAKVQRYLIAMTLTLVAALLIERGPDGLWAVENDRISLLHVVVFGALALAWSLVAVLPRSIGRGGGMGRKHVLGRAGWAAVGLLAVALVMLVLFPELRAGPLGRVDPLYAEVRLRRIVEIQPLLPPDWLADGKLGPSIHRVVRFVGLAFLAIPFLAVLLVRERGGTRRIWASIALALGIFLILAFYQVRWASYTQVLLVLSYSALMGWLLGRVADRIGARALSLCRAPLIVAGLLWPILLLLLLPQARIELAGQSCPIDRIAPALDRVAGGESRTVLALADHGPEILYRTDHSVLSIPNHRPQPGFAATYQVLTGRDDAKARAILTEYGVGLILLCPSRVERSMFAPADGDDGHLYHRLAEGAAPPWLRPLPIAQDLADHVRLFELVPDPAAAEGAITDADRS